MPSKDFTLTKNPPYDLTDIPPLVIGGAVFNTQYSEDPESMPIRDILRVAFSKGLVALDTSPYYGKSEELIGNALSQISDEWPREKYFICTKAGRIRLNDFDYSRDLVRKSVLRSLQRLRTSYLDLVYLHDIEFVSEQQTYEALKELVALKKEGVIRNFGVTGYPVDYLLKIAMGSKNEYAGEIGPLDAILSYSNGCLQNTKLFEAHDRFMMEAGVRKVFNGSILSMSLLRSGKTHDFHPAPLALKGTCDQISQRLLEQDQVELAELATKYAIEKSLFTSKTDEENRLVWNKACSVVLGVSSVEELTSAIQGYEHVQANNNSNDHQLYERVQRELGPEHLNETWPSGIDH
ncbi:Aldo/keto reductase [Metschnikowia bicuspidata var. bicuspidata NRRL YB-4993]|uniref:Aldo/keto reductase n=1 Tax=Metschnikowia bicuspidata var. bicuspidata NRRL YB-4993 TaxID=869754 RepID=A0A1A0HFQ8_9ASCO|nr:Aldo/keto reductase [Metschnikowia bicuspidata var. bicuspidata NRRL YB-4993]OBA22693.1 Aldo/keto reductase [Metschnikowia bicuspidata var. bicuspidata NRRL YB-4993]